MVTTAEAISVLRPMAMFGADGVQITERDGITTIVWKDAFGTQPTPAEISAVTQAQVDAEKLAKVRAEAKLIHSQMRAENRALRALVKLIVNELNLVRQAITTLKTVTASSTNYATLKSGIATLPATPDRTYAQAQTAINALIDGE